MTSALTLEQRYHACREILAPRGQEHVLAWWDELDSQQRADLLTDLESIPWDVLDALVESHVLNSSPSEPPADLSPPLIHPSKPGPDRTPLYDKAKNVGRQLIQAGKVAAFTVAGGQGTRLGHDGPKGTLVVTPVAGRTLFQLFAESILATRRRYDAVVPWYVMTSRANHTQTVGFFERHDFFGLPRQDVMLFRQGMLPAFDFSGRLLLDGKHSVALAPDGHGGSLKALVESGALEQMRSRGIDIISYFQVDNPLVSPLDPLFIGLHAETDSEMSSKVTAKADDLERVGNVCMQGGSLRVIEYSEFPDHLARARDADGRRKFDAANLAIHLLDVAFVRRIVGESFRLPFRRAEKTVVHIDKDGAVQQPGRPNAVKLEMFVFDALPLARNPLLLEVERAEEFSPIKNPTGVDSLKSSQRDQIARSCRWLESSGVHVPRKPNGDPDIAVEIAPGFALDAAGVKDKANAIPALKPGGAVCLD